jgi:uncharacterized protein YqhQ
MKNIQRDKVKKKTSIGGQALIEGIMMRGPKKTAMAVRNPEGEIVIESFPTAGKNRSRLLKLPFIRGVFNFVDSMSTGYRCLMRSAEMAGLDEDEPSPHKTEAVVAEGVAPAEQVEHINPEQVEEQTETVTAEKKENKDFFKSFGMTLVLVLSVLLGTVVAVGLFITLPAFLFNSLRQVVPVLDNNIWRAVVEGLIRILLFVAYISTVSLMKDIKRVFMYHGAEHKTIFCYEKGEELTVENVRRQTRFHPRCGTSFMIFMLIIGIIVSMFIPATNPLVRTALKLLTIPIIVGIGYELIKLAGRSESRLVRVLSAPGIWLQRITTKEPTDDMIEVAIKAFNEVIPEDLDSDKI